MKLIYILSLPLLYTTTISAQQLSGTWAGTPVSEQINNYRSTGFNDSYLTLSLSGNNDSCYGTTAKKLRSGLIITSAFAGHMLENGKQINGKEIYEIESPSSQKYYYLACSYDLTYKLRKGVEYLEGTMRVNESENNYPSTSFDRNGQIAIPETRPVTYTVKLKRINSGQDTVVAHTVSSPASQ
jgi:hypothetical protein